MATESTTAEQLRLRDRLARLRTLPLLRGVGVSGELERLQRQIDRIAAEPSQDEVWQAILLARHQDRPYTLDYVERLFEDFVELHGDRSRADDKAIVAGLAGSPAGRSVSWAIKRHARFGSGWSGTTVWRTPRATRRRCG